MRKQFIFLAAVAVSLMASTHNVRAGWPARVFAPYMYVGAGDNFKLTDCDDQCGLKYYTLAFIIARQDGTRQQHRLPPGAVVGRPHSHRIRTFTTTRLMPSASAAAMSSCPSAARPARNSPTSLTIPAQLEAAYQKVIDQYKFTWLDFDVEGNNLDQGRLDSERRNTALASLQKKNPGLIVSYTLPVDPNGLSEASQALLTDAVKKGVKVHSANLMVMFFGKEFINKGKSEGQLGVDSANAAHAQLQKIDPAIQVGLCPCLGRNGSEDEVFTLDDAKILKAFADKTPWVCSLHYWSINDDAARPRNKGKPTPTPSPSPNSPQSPGPSPKFFRPSPHTDSDKANIALDVTVAHC